MTTQQLVVDLENEPGRLFTVTEAIALAGINVHALALSDNGQTGTARMLVSDVRRARSLVMELDVPARTEDVLLIEIPDTPGSLAALLEPLFDDYVNIVSLNAFSAFDGRAVAVIRFTDNPQAEGILREHGHEPLDIGAVFPAVAEDEE
ncbi:MAG: amino acid-binding protein [Spirochaetota bacterium]